jgi:tetratricopeptide (TPR) repeat protein
MSSEALYERYKDALKRGHVASLRGHLDEALLAYAEAAAIAPERPTPHASAGTALLRRKRPAEALRHYDVALALAPRDETAMAGRAQALAALGRRGEAADAYDALAEARAADGRLSDAVDAARLGLELAEGRDRRRILERLIDRLRTADQGEPGRLALEQALRALDGMAVPRDAAPLAPGDADDPGRSPAAGATAIAPDPGPDGAATLAAAGPEPVSGPRRPLDRDLPDGVTTAGLADLADAAVEAAAPGAALERLLDLAAAYRRDGSVDAAIDACYLALSFDPDSVGLHLALVELYDERGWDAVAGEKLDLVERLARLDGDDEALARVVAARAGRG